MAFVAFVLLAFVVSVLSVCSQEVFQIPEEWQGAPVLETFATYEEMQRYFDNRNLRRLRFLENPTDDSYISAYNDHHEQQSSGIRSKRDNSESRKLPSEPSLVKFEISDAVEPSDEVKQIIRQHRNREAKAGNTTPVNKESLSRKETSSPESKDMPQQILIPRRVKKIGKRLKRSALRREPKNFQVEFIKFEASDAREPDERTRDMIKRLRALDSERSKNSEPTEIKAKLLGESSESSRSPVLSAKHGKAHVKPQKRNRSRRSAPQMVKFELEDAREPDESTKALMQQQKSTNRRESKDIKFLDVDLQNKTRSAGEDPKMSPSSPSTPSNDAKSTPADVDSSDDDQASHESKRLYVFKEAPGPIKIKKSINSLPHEVQKVVTHLLKDMPDAKAYVKYIPSQKMDYEYLKTSQYNMGQGHFGAKLQSGVTAQQYGKYVPQPQLQRQQQQQPKPIEMVPIQIRSVPVVEKIRYVYSTASTEAPSYQHVHHLPNAQSHAYNYLPQKYAMPQPIVVSESTTGHVSHPQPTEVHHTYTADLTQVTHHFDTPSASAIKDVPAPQFRPSKPDPLLESNKLGESQQLPSMKATHIPVESYKYEIFSQNPTHNDFSQSDLHLIHQQRVQDESAKSAAAPVIKIEYHAPPDPIKENYKDLQEFKELSTLMGKSPEDQIHGLTYLLAKEMQSKLHSQQLQRQQKKLEGEALLHRPQDSTSPIVFHPNEENDDQRPHSIQNYLKGQLGVQPGKLIGMAKSKQYIPIVEHSASNEEKSAELTTPRTSSYQEFGLSPNYEGLHQKAETQQKVVVHHPSVSHHGLLGISSHQDNKLHQSEDSQSLQYASKYAFGYRIRDFHTGNDFGHKQNRDLDGVTRGQYHILLPDGRIQNVIYHADKTGFHADVSFETGH